MFINSLYNLFLAILFAALINAPVAYAGGFANTFVNAISSIVAVISFFVPGLTLLSAGLGLLSGASNLIDSGGCSPVSFISCAGGGSGPLPFAIPAVSSGSSCLADITFYDNVGPHAQDEQNSTVQIYRFTLPKTARFWPWY